MQEKISIFQGFCYAAENADIGKKELVYAMFGGTCDILQYSKQ